MSDFTQALIISFIGMTTVFTGLVVLAFAIKLLERFIGPRRLPERPREAPLEREPGPGREVVAAIAASLIAYGVNPKHITVREQNSK